MGPRRAGPAARVRERLLSQLLLPLCCVSGPPAACIHPPRSCARPCWPGTMRTTACCHGGATPTAAARRPPPQVCAAAFGHWRTPLLLCMTGNKGPRHTFAGPHEAAEPAPAALDAQAFAYHVWVSEIMLQQTQVRACVRWLPRLQGRASAPCAAPRRTVCHRALLCATCATCAAVRPWPAPCALAPGVHRAALLPPLGGAVAHRGGAGGSGHGGAEARVGGAGLLQASAGGCAGHGGGAARGKAARGRAGAALRAADLPFVRHTLSWLPHAAAAARCAQARQVPAGRRAPRGGAAGRPVPRDCCGPYGHPWCGRARPGCTAARGLGWAGPGLWLSGARGRAGGSGACARTGRRSSGP